MTRRLTRRTFVKGTLAGAAALTIPMTVTRNVLGANDELLSATIGVGGRGGSHIDAMYKIPGVRVVGACDADAKNLGRTADGLAKKLDGQKVLAETDIRKLLDHKELDVVTIASPNHWHSLMAIWAMERGKHVYVEKPVSHNVFEGRQAVHASRKYNKICQTGTQSRASRKGIGAAVEYVRSGELGKILYAIGTCYKPRQSIGKLKEPLKIPDNIDYDLWCGPAAKVDLYRPKLHYDWHWDFNTGNGDLGNQGIHQMDIARWFLGEQTLSPKVMSIGGRLGYDDAGNTANTQVIFHDYEKAPLIFEVRGLPKEKLDWKTGMDNYRGAGVGVLVQCEGGHVVIPNYYSTTAYDKEGKKIKDWRETDPMTPHVANFIEAVKTGKRDNQYADIEEGHLSSALCHTGNISYQLGKKAKAGEIREQIKGNKVAADSYDRMAEHLGKNGVDISGETLTIGPWLTMDVKTEKFTGEGADKANKLITRPYREGFVVPNLAPLA